MAPDRLLGAPASVASDIYAFAAIAYELLTGRRPFNPDSPSPIAAIPLLMTMQRNQQVIPPRQLRPSVSEAAQAIVLRGLAFDPTARLADARQFGDELAQALAIAGDPTQAAVTLLAQPAAGVATPPGASLPALPLPEAAPAPPGKRPGWLVAAAVTVAPWS